MEPAVSTAPATRARVEAVAQTFLAERGVRLTDPDLCRDTCIEVAEAFAARLQGDGITAHAVTGAEFGRVAWFPEVDIVLNAHAATLVMLDRGRQESQAAWVWDFTARQFDPVTPCPLTQPLAAWRQRWRPLGPQERDEQTAVHGSGVSASG